MMAFEMTVYVLKSWGEEATRAVEVFMKVFHLKNSKEINFDRILFVNCEELPEKCCMSHD